MHRRAEPTSGRRPEQQVEPMEAPEPRPRGAPHSGGVPNERGYQEDQPRDAESAECCALLRPLPHAGPAPVKSPVGTSRIRRRRIGKA